MNGIIIMVVMFGFCLQSVACDVLLSRTDYELDV